MAVGGAILAESALHPGRTRTAVETDALVNRIAIAHGASSRSVFLQEPDRTRVHAYWLARPNAARTVMILHGIGDSAYGSAGYAPFLLDHGFNVLLPDSRGQGQSDGINTFGLDEAGDVARWSDWLRGNTATIELDGLGESLGAGVLLSSLAGHVPFHAVAAECAYSSFISIAGERVTAYLPPGFAMRVAAKGLVESGLLYTRIRYGKNLWPLVRWTRWRGLPCRCCSFTVWPTEEQARRIQEGWHERIPTQCCGWSRERTMWRRTPRSLRSSSGECSNGLNSWKEPPKTRLALASLL